jgi:hypothetical protein
MIYKDLKTKEDRVGESDGETSAIIAWTLLGLTVGVLCVAVYLTVHYQAILNSIQ